MAEWIGKIGQTVGWKGRIVLVPQGRLPEPISWGINTDQDIVVDSTRIREELGYHEHISPDEALKRTIAWERANPPEKINPKQFDYETEDAILAELDSFST
jgi:nucleoside-diphosphate-sugar epimerase